jgi:glycosyltransferase involved in cell wall biosynthesis
MGTMSTLKKIPSINLLFIIYGLERGGTELRLLDFAKYFPDDIKVHIHVTSDNLTLLSYFQKHNTNVKSIPITKGYLEINKILKIFEYVKAHNISIVNAFDLKDLTISTILMVFSRFQIKTVYHSVDILHRYHRFQKGFLGLLLKSVTSVICNSRQSKDIMTNLGTPEKRIKVIKNGVDTNHFRFNKYKARCLRKKVNFDKEVLVLGSIANFRKVKNYPFLLRAFKVLVQKNANLKLICVGDGYYMREMKDLRRKYRLENSIIFTGYSDNVVEYLSMMDIFVLCSLHEGLPNVLLQAMSMGLPVVSSNVGGCPEVINDMQNGILFPSNNLGKFTEAVEILINDKRFAAKLGRNARKTVEEKFSLERMILDYSAFYRELALVSARR